MTEKILGEIKDERKKQDERYSVITREVSPFDTHNISVIVAQLGEASESLNYLNSMRSIGVPDEETGETIKAAYRKKIISVAACAIQVLEKLDQSS